MTDIVSPLARIEVSIFKVGIFCYPCFYAILDPTVATIHVQATTLTSHSIQITWELYIFSSSSSVITGYLISYTTTASYTTGGSVTVYDYGTTSHELTNLEEYTEYIIFVQATTNDNRMSARGNSNEVSVRTYSDGE